MRKFIKWLKNKHRSIASCCGHGKYPMTIIVQEGLTSRNGLKKRIVNREIFSQKIIPRKRNFYKRDKQGYYYIPETLFQSMRKKK